MIVSLLRRLFPPTHFMRQCGYVAFVRVPVLGWCVRVDSSGKVWWR